MKTYIIDGNNLIGKIHELKKLPKNDSSSRQRLAHILDRYFAHKKVKVSLHYDGFANVPVKSNRCKITYSNERPADDFIRIEISNAKNPKHVNLVTSDFALAQFAKKCSCTIIKSEEFTKSLSEEEIDTEKEIIKSIDNDELLKLFQNRK